MYHPARKISLLQHHHIPPPSLQLLLLILYPRTALATAIHPPMPILLLLAPLPLKLLISTITPSPPHPITSYTPMDYSTPNMPYSHSHYPSQNHTAIPTLFTYSSSPYTSSNHSGHQPIPSTLHNISTESSFNPQLTPYSQFLSHNTSHSTSIDIASTYCLDLYLGHLIHS